MRRFLSQDFCLLLCCTLSAVVIAGMVFWLDGDAPAITSELALQEAERTLQGYCDSQGNGGCAEVRLVGANAPGEQEGQWNFEFYSPVSGRMKVTVDQEESRVEPVADQPGNRIGEAASVWETARQTRQMNR